MTLVEHRRYSTDILSRSIYKYLIYKYLICENDASVTRLFLIHETETRLFAITTFLVRMPFIIQSRFSRQRSASKGASSRASCVSLNEIFISRCTVAAFIHELRAVLCNTRLDAVR